MKKVILFILIFTDCVKAQIIDFNIKVETEKYISYSQIKLDEMICKGDSIFGYNKDEGRFYSSFDKGITFNNIETNKFCNKCNFISNRDKVFGVNFFFLKGNNIIFRVKSKFYESNDWLNFHPINKNSKSDLPIEVQKIQKEDENYWLLNSFYVNDTYFLTFSGYNGSNYKNYYSKDLISWKEIPKPNNLAIASYEGIKYYNNSIFLFTWDTKNKSIAYYSSDFGKNWKELIGLHYKFSDGFGNASIQNIMIFNNKIYYENLITPYAPSIYDIEKKTTTSISSQYPFIKYPKIKDDYIYFTSKNKIWIYKNDSISELKIDYSKFKNIEDALITENYIVIDGIKSLVTNGLSEKEKNKYLAIDKESKYVQAKTITKEDSSNSNGIVTNNYNQNNSNKKQFDCVEINLSNKKPTKSMANLFMAKVNDDNSIKKIICENNGQVYEILDKNLFRIGYKIIERKENKIKNLYIFDNNGLLYVHHLYEYSEGNTYIYHYNYTGMVISLEVNNKYNNYQASMKEGVTKEKALNNYLNRNNIKVVSPSQNKSYSSDGSKCNNCRLGLYVRGTCSQCGAVSQERLYESLSKRPNCQACRGMRYIKGFNGMRLCPICRGTGKQTY